MEKISIIVTALLFLNLVLFFYMIYQRKRVKESAEDLRDRAQYLNEHVIPSLSAGYKHYKHGLKTLLSMLNLSMESRLVAEENDKELSLLCEDLQKTIVNLEMSEITLNTDLPKNA